jgi:hypothetical protein
MENENEVIVARQEQKRELKMELADVVSSINAARLDEARLTELVNVYGQRAERPNLEATGRQIAALLESQERIEAELLTAEQRLGGIYRRDTLSNRLAEEHQLTDAQREQLKASLERGTPESEVGRRAAQMSAQNNTESLKTRNYSFQPESGVAW